MKRFVLLLMALGTAVAAQTPPVGLNRWSSAQSFRFGSVDRSTLANRFVIPIFTRATVGNAQVGLVLAYNSNFWIGAKPFNFGWSLVQPFGTLASSEDIEYQYCGYWNNNTNQYDEWFNLVTDSFTFTEPDGSQASGSTAISEYLGEGGGQRQQGDDYDCPGLSSDPATVLIPDGKGFSIVVTGIDAPGATAQVFDSRGDEVDGLFKDPNGNEVTVTVSGGVTSYHDPLGNDPSGNPALTASGAGTATSPVIFSWTGPTGAQASVTEHFATQNVTSAGCGTYTGSPLLPAELDLADGSKYLFGYDSAGRVSSVTLPTGATINYSYTLDCTDNSNSALSRWDSVNGPGLDWSWARAQNGSGAVTTTETNPSANDSVFTFAAPYWPGQGGALTGASFYQGTGSGRAELETLTAVNSRTGGAVTGQALTDELFQGGNPLLCRQHSYSYNATGQALSIYDYDWGTCPSGGGLLRNVTTTYIVTGHSSLPSEITVSPNSGSGGQIAQTTFSYQAGTGDVLNETDSTSSSASLTKSFTYNPNGTVATATDGNGGVTTFTYGACNGIFATKTQSAVPVVYSTATWDCRGGVPLSSVDANNATTSITYSDPLWRPAQISYPDGGAATFAYTPNSLETRRQIDASRWTDAETLLDALGRPEAASSLNGAGTYDRVDTCYNAMGEVSFSSYPHTVASATAAPNCSGTGDSYQFDALGRIATVTHSDGSAFLTSYAGRAVETQDEGNGVTRVTRISQSDGLGRLAAVCEVAAVAINGADGAPAACGLDITATGFLTTYSRDALGNILQVSQGQQTRGYAYDWLSRLTSETNPENGVTAYTYDGNSNVLTRTRPAPNQTGSATVTTTYAWDDLNRLGSASYSDGTTPTRHFMYDSGGLWGQTLQNPIGHLSEAWVGGSPLVAAEIFSYDAMGRDIQNWQCTPADCGSTALKSSYGYDLAGDNTWETRETVPGGYAYGLNYSFDATPRPAGITGSISDSQHPGTLASTLQYNAFGELTGEALGNGVQASWSFDGRGRLTSQAAGSEYNLASLTYAPDGDVATANDSVNGNWSYGYDSLNRLSSAGDATVGYSYGYDRRGNRWQQSLTAGSGPQFSSAFGLNNQMVPASGYSFDAAGNVTSDGNCAYSYDAENELIGVSRCTTATYSYNAFGTRVRIVVGGSPWDLVLDRAGRVASVFGQNMANWNVGEIYAGGRHLGTYANGTTYFSHLDWLGNERAWTGMGASDAGKCGNLPFGDAITCSSGSNIGPFHYTGQYHDNESGLDYFQARHYAAAEGRFVSPDPSGLAAVDPNNPQSWDKYVYTLNGPLEMVDKNGAWPTNIHNQIYEQALPGLTNSLLGALEAGSANVDRLGNQGSGGANQHSMCSPGQSMDACDAGISSFIMGNIAHAQADGFNILGMYDLGAAVHTFTDMTSPWHTGGDGSPMTWSLSLNPGTWLGALGHAAGEDLIAGILNSQAFGQAIAQAVLNTRAALNEAFPDQYAAATSGQITTAGQKSWAGIFLSTGAFPSTVLLGQVEGCLEGNPAACPGAGDFQFFGLMGGTDSFYTGYFGKLPVK